MKEKKIGKEKLIIGILSAAVAALLAAVIVLTVRNKGRGSTDKPILPSERPGENRTVPPSEFPAANLPVPGTPVPKDTALCEVETPFCKLSYPAEWKDSIRINKIEEEIYTVEFYAEIDDREYHLFDFVFGGDEKEAFGVMQTEKGVAAVLMNLCEIEGLEKMNSEQAQTLLTMQDYAFAIIDMLTENYGLKINS